MKTKRAKYIITESMHTEIKKMYQTKTGSGEVRTLAEKWDIPRWKISRYAIQQGFTPLQHKEPNWSEEEIKILERNVHLTPEVIQRKLKAKGFKRSVIGIVLKRKRLHLLRSLNGQSATQLAICFGVDIHFVTRAIKLGKLKASMRHTKRTIRNGGDIYYIKDKHIRNYIINNVHEIDFRKIDKYWVVDILAGKYLS